MGKTEHLVDKRVFPLTDIIIAFLFWTFRIIIALSTTLNKQKHKRNEKHNPDKKLTP